MMKFYSPLKNTICGVLTAGLLAVPLSFSAVPSPAAEADASSLIGAAIGGIAAHAQLNAVLRKIGRAHV